MHKSIRLFGLLLATCGLLLMSGVADAHSLQSDKGYTAVMHIDPDDDPLAGQPTVINFLIGKDGGSYNQNNYSIAVDISAAGKQLHHSAVEPEGFGDAGDGIVKYTFPVINAYTIDLRGYLKTDPATQFHMSFIVRIAGTAAGSETTTSNNGPIVLLLSAGSLVLLGVGSFVGVRRGKRYGGPH